MAPHLDPTETLACLGRFLDGQELDTSAPNARLPHAGGIARADQLSSLPPARLVLVRPRLLAWRHDAERPVGWFAAEGPRPVTIAAGFTADGRIGWATLAPAPAEWSWADGEREALADLPFSRGARNWLEAAYERLYGLEPAPVLATLPEAAFGCQGSATCCRAPYRVDVPAAYQAVVDAIPALGGVQLPVLADGRLEVKPAGRACGFLAPDGRCKVHAALGRPLFPACAVFPFSFAHTPDGLDVAASSLCGAARANLGPPLESRRDDLRQRLAVASVPPLQTPVYRLAHGRVVSWAAFRKAEGELLALLGRADLPLKERLWQGTLLLGEGGEPATPEEARGLLAPFLEAAGCSAPSLHQPCEPLLRNLIFSKVHSYPFDLATAFNLAIVLALCAGGDQEALGWMVMHGGGMRFLWGEAGRERRERLSDPAFGRGLLALTEA